MFTNFFTFSEKYKANQVLKLQGRALSMEINAIPSNSAEEKRKQPYQYNKKSGKEISKICFIIRLQK